MRTLVIGSGNLSSRLMDLVDGVVNISTRDVLSSRKDLWSPFLGEKVTLIFNNFQASSKLNGFNNLESYMQRSILCTAVVLDAVKSLSIKVEKIIYTSTCALYGNNQKASECSKVKVENLYTSLKRANESLVEQFCVDNSIGYTIARLFNMYGGKDNFSVISKIKKNIERKIGGLRIVNPSSVRDFIHIDDVVNMYKRIMEIRELPPIINVGTGIATSLNEILDVLDEDDRELIEIVENVNQEIVRSCSDNSLLREIIGEDYEFVKVKHFLEMKC